MASGCRSGQCSAGARQRMWGTRDRGRLVPLDLTLGLKSLPEGRRDNGVCEECLKHKRVCVCSGNFLKPLVLTLLSCVQPECNWLSLCLGRNHSCSFSVPSLSPRPVLLRSPFLLPSHFLHSPTEKHKTVPAGLQPGTPQSE